MRPRSAGACPESQYAKGRGLKACPYLIRGWAMSDEKAVPFNSSAALIEEAKKERQRLIEQIEQSQRTIEHSRQVIARIDEVLAATQKK